MKTYYHVSRDIKNIVKTFHPRIPSSFLVGGNENRDIKRVCLAEDFIDCMNAINYLLDSDVYNEQQGYKLLRVYKFELDEQYIVPSEEVHRYVYDALINKECWSLREISPSDSFIIQPTYISTGNISPVHISYMDFDRVDEYMNVIG